MSLFALSLGVKLLGVAYVGAQRPAYLRPQDAESVYRPIALGLLGGEGYRLAGDPRDATRVPPLYPLYLAGVYAALGPDLDLRWLGVLNALMRAMTTVLVFRLGQRLLGTAAGTAGGLLFALDPWEALWAAQPLKESLAVLLSVASVGVTWRAVEGPTGGRGMLAGVALGLATLARYLSLGLFPCSILLAWANARSTRGIATAARLTVGLTAGLVLTLSPWLLRNYRLFGEIVLSPHFAGRYFYTANGPGAEKAPMAGYSEAPLEAPAFVRSLERGYDGPAATEWAFFSGAARHLWSHPSVGVTLLETKVVTMLRPTYQGASWPNMLILGGAYCAFLGLGSLGFVLTWQHRASLRMLYLVLSFYAAAHLLFFAEIRYRQYLTPFVAPFAGYALAALVARWRHDA